MLAKGLRSRQARARALVLAAIIASTTARVVAVASPLPRIAAGAPTGIEGVTVLVEALMYRNCDAWPIALQCLVD